MNLEKQDSYKCSKCKDVGLVEIVKEEGIFYRECECREIERMRNILEQSGISNEYQKISVNQYKVYSQATRLAKKAAIDYVMHFEEIKNDRQNSIAFLGQVGAGKTHLSIAIANALMNRGIPVRYMPYRDVITELKQNMLDEEFYQREIEKYKKAKVLLIDDLFKGKTTEADINIIFEIINHRYLARMPIIVSSEYIPEKLLAFDGAIGSRIIEMCKSYLVVIQGEENNYRLKGVV